MTNEEYMRCALDEAFAGMRNNQGGPFGAVVVRDGVIIGKGSNRVTSTNDPTAHAEIVALRAACKKSGTFHLPGAVLFTSCEPCPMCMAAIYWAGIETVYYCSDRNDAAEIGFNDKFIYDELSVPISERAVKMQQISLQAASDLFHEWKNKQDKTPY